MIQRGINWTQIPAAQYPILQKYKKTRRMWHKGNYHESIYTDGKFYYHKDPLHGKVEKYDQKGKHIGVRFQQERHIQ